MRPTKALKVIEKFVFDNNLDTKNATLVPDAFESFEPTATLSVSSNGQELFNMAFNNTQFYIELVSDTEDAKEKATQLTRQMRSNGITQVRV